MFSMSLLLIWITWQKISEVLTNEPFYFGRWIKTSLGDRNVDFYTFDWKLKVSKKDCVEICRYTDRCEYINYEARFNLCALVKMKDDREGRLPMVELRPGFIYMNKSEWNNDRTPIPPNNCVTDTLVNRDVEDCKKSGCGYPVNGDFKGNMFSPGSQILLKCRLDNDSSFIDFDFVRSTCTDNGTWSNPFKCQSYYNGSYYHVQLTFLTWHHAKMSCESISGHLVDLNSPEEQAFVLKVIQDENTHYPDIWIGGNDLEIEGTFRWSERSPVDLMSKNWKGANPDNFLNMENCIELIWFDGSWNDAMCHIRKLSICEFP